ncbi:MAG: ferredoxin reductase [Hyphomicrobiales bacterium]|nr:ferredoxin reductase [Hyphomicrobiales bacterium]
MRWQTAVVTGIVRRSAVVSSFIFRLPELTPFIAGQHVSVRLTAPDGYRAQRSYSIASAPAGSDYLELAIEKLENGEVSPFFHDVVVVGDEIEVSEPIGGHFVWTPEDAGPVLLVGGGSGIVPFISMARQRALVASTAPMVLLFSARTSGDLLFREELMALAEKRDGFELVSTLTRDAAPPEGVLTGRIGAATIANALGRLPAKPRRVYVCGSNPFVENATQHAIDAGVEPTMIATERYGV